MSGYKGIVRGITAKTVDVQGKGFFLNEKVFVGKERLAGEVISVKKDGAVVQVYEDLTGVSLKSPVFGTGEPLSVFLCPGHLGRIFNGLQSPLEFLAEKEGAFLSRGTEEETFLEMGFYFYPEAREGDRVERYSPLGYVQEGPFKHYIHTPSSGKLRWIRKGEFKLKEPVAEMDDGSIIYAYERWPVRRPRPVKRRLPPEEPLITGQRVIDVLFPIPKGTTAVLPGGFGTGKTVLEQTIAKFASVDIVIYIGCGERGNEIAELLDDFRQLKDPYFDRPLLDRTILIVNTSNMPVSAREASVYTGVSIAEYYRDMGYDVLLLADSISRWAEALREISSTLEEMPAEEGYPTYLPARISGFFERASVVETLSGKRGSLTMILSVSPPGGDITEPVTQAAMRIAGVFLMLDTALAHKRHFPAINWKQSYSLYRESVFRYFSEKIERNWRRFVEDCTKTLQTEEEIREIAEIIGLESLTDQDRSLLKKAEEIRNRFLCQSAYTEDAFCPPERAINILKEIFRE